MESASTSWAPHQLNEAPCKDLKSLLVCKGIVAKYTDKPTKCSFSEWDDNGGIPDVIFELRNLCHLDLSYTAIRAVPHKIGWCFIYI